MFSETQRTSKLQSYTKVVTAIGCYWIFSIGTVFVNKYLLSSNALKLNAPLFITWFQCLVSVFICIILSKVSRFCPELLDLPEMTIHRNTCKKTLPLSLVFVGMIAFNNLCLQNVSVSFYYVSRSLSTVFSVVLTYLIMYKKAAPLATYCCFFIVFGFCLGVNQEDLSGSISTVGVFYGVLASFFVALYAFLTRSALKSVDNNLWKLAMYNNLNALILFIPLVALNGEIGEVINFPLLRDPAFWVPLVLSGFLGFMMSYVTGWQIQATSPLTHNISGTAKAAAQTVIAVIYWAEAKTALWWLSNFTVLFGSTAYTYVQKTLMDARLESEKLRQEEMSALSSKSQSTSQRPSVTIDANVINHERRQVASDTPVKVTVPPPKVPAGMPPMRDEIEMLRSGYKDQHGNATKTQGAELKIDIN
ncbi:unnamed protein product [Caenorhabditis auriculariae]|uniref:Sugar phosphate transporter domain-containing protein n=1 Tax=Caenorhabditis auriculariae TaxID=2777116 RepID=A0A8S1HUY5_9PELO|nr:unnamed protein product [Caenorhabditis auriculariae]